MSCFSGPNLITSSLVLDLDAGNLKSYTGSGTNYYDVSGNSNKASMYGTAPFSTDGGGCFDFSTITGAASSSASMGFTFSSEMVTPTGSFTISTWIKNPPATAGQCGMFSNSTSGNGYRFGVGQNGIYYLIGPPYTEGGISFISTFDNSKWHNIVAVFDRTGVLNSGTAQMQMYLDGVFQGTGYIPASQTTFSWLNGPPGLVRSACCSLYTGKIATLSVHNIPLTSTQILQNFISLHGRFGI